MKRGFTLIELVVAVAVLAIVSSFAGVIFNVSIDSHRTAAANAEIMQNLRAITDQLNADFKGLRTDMPGRISFGYEQSFINGVIEDVNSDRIAFFANGDFQSTGQYGDGAETIAGNVASIFYGLIDVNSYSVLPPPPQDKVLARRQTILTADSDSSLDSYSYPQGEYYRRSLSQWRAEWDVNDSAFDVLMVRPRFDLGTEEGLVTYMARGVDNFTIEYEDGYTPDNRIMWSRESEQISTRAFRFTFTLYDSRGIIPEGRTFTHIVFLGR